MSVRQLLLQSHHPQYSRYDCGRILEYIRDISILGRLGLYLYPTISVGETPYPPKSCTPICTGLNLNAINPLYTDSIILHNDF
jgi:hypothetical protein